MLRRFEPPSQLASDADARMMLRGDSQSGEVTPRPLAADRIAPKGIIIEEDEAISAKPMREVSRPGLDPLAAP